MATSKQLHRLATRPSDYVRFIQTGRLPQGVRPQGPLVDLLRALAPHDLQAFKGLVVDERLGYVGSRRFYDAGQALRWIAPSNEVFDAFPAESCRIKSFNRRLTLRDLQPHCAQFPEALLSRYPRLAGPTPVGT